MLPNHPLSQQAVPRSPQTPKLGFREERAWPATQPVAELATRSRATLPTAPPSCRLVSLLLLRIKGGFLDDLTQGTLNEGARQA